MIIKNTYIWSPTHVSLGRAWGWEWRRGFVTAAWWMLWWSTIYLSGDLFAANTFWGSTSSFWVIKNIDTLERMCPCLINGPQFLLREFLNVFENVGKNEWAQNHWILDLPMWIDEFFSDKSNVHLFRRGEEIWRPARLIERRWLGRRQTNERTISTVERMLMMMAMCLEDQCRLFCMSWKIKQWIVYFHRSSPVLLLLFIFDWLDRIHNRAWSYRRNEVKNNVFQHLLTNSNDIRSIDSIEHLESLFSAALIDSNEWRVFLAEENDIHLISNKTSARFLMGLTTVLCKWSDSRRHLLLFLICSLEKSGEDDFSPLFKWALNENDFDRHQ